MDAWETLIDNSTLTPPGFDAWEHLNNQEGGGEGPGGTLILADGLRIGIELDAINAYISDTGYLGVLEDENVITIEDEQKIIVTINEDKKIVKLTDDKYNITI